MTATTAVLVRCTSCLGYTKRIPESIGNPCGCGGKLERCRSTRGRRLQSVRINLAEGDEEFLARFGNVTKAANTIWRAALAAARKDAALAKVVNPSARAHWRGKR